MYVYIEQSTPLGFGTVPSLKYLLGALKCIPPQMGERDYYTDNIPNTISSGSALKPRDYA
jgi:hypothetical protein